jgi:hypothetical protein
VDAIPAHRNIARLPHRREYHGRARFGQCADDLGLIRRQHLNACVSALLVGERRGRL